MNGTSSFINSLTSPLHLNGVLIITIAAGTLLMVFSLWAPWWPEAAKDVLPFATGLVGFAGGLVTAIFGKAGPEGTTGIDMPKMLGELKQLQINGTITEKEFNDAKKKLLKKI